MMRIVHVTDEVLAPVIARYGSPADLRWEGEISEPELALATYNPRRVHDVTLFVLDPDERIALIRKPQFAEGIWRPPGGGIKPGEDFAAGAEREALEETGLEVQLERYLVDAHARFTCDGRALDWRTHVLLARTTGTELVPQDPADTASHCTTRRCGLTPTAERRSASCRPGRAARTSAARSRRSG